MRTLKNLFLHLSGADAVIRNLESTIQIQRQKIGGLEAWNTDLKNNSEQLYDRNNELSEMCKKYSASISIRDEQINELKSKLEEREARVQELAMQVLQLSNVPSTMHHTVIHNKK